MTKQEKIRGEIGRIIKKWYAPIDNYAKEGYGESCEQEIVVYLHKQDVVLRVKDPNMIPVAFRVAVEPLILE